MFLKNNMYVIFYKISKYQPQKSTSGPTLEMIMI